MGIHRRDRKFPDDKNSQGGNMMKREKKPNCSDITRKSFILRAASLGTALSLYPLLGCKKEDGKAGSEKIRTGKSAASPKVVVTGDPAGRVLLKKGLIADGTGKKSFTGDVLVNGTKIEAVTTNDLIFNGRTIDCSGKIIAPGFIDMHSHNDWVFTKPEHSKFTSPFTAQGITTFVTGNCGFGIAGFEKNSPYKSFIENKIGKFLGNPNLPWNSMEDYFTVVRRQGITHNLANLAGHGTTRMSIRGFKPAPMGKDEMKKLLALLDEAMGQGCHGVSLGLQYEPGIFATDDELKQVARLVKKHDKILTVHLKAYSSLSPTYPLIPFGKAHNLLALKEMLEIARETGVRLQVSHLIFVGTDTWDTCGDALALIDKAVRDGVDVKFDTYAYHCGTSYISVVLPAWFLARVPLIYNDKSALRRLKLEFMVIKWLLGFGYEDIQITNAGKPDLDKYNGMFLEEIAKKRNMDQFDNFIDLAKRTEGKAGVLNHRYSSLDNVKDLMSHPASLFMTDAWVFPEGLQNPGAYGCFPRFLQYARDFRNISMEEAVRKMTGASAERFNVKKRGFLKEGYAADITVFDWNTVKDNNTDRKTDTAPSGIEAVFINGKQVIEKGRADGSLAAGQVIL
jgi:N-acyl-D-amino-acid deacylase